MRITPALRHTFFLGAIASWGAWVYPLLVLAIFFEGEAVIYTVMFLTFEKIISAWITVPLIFVSVMFTDFISYSIGARCPKYFPRIAHYYEKLTSPMDARLKSVSFSVYLISKFTYGFHRAVLIRSGMIGIPVKKLFAINFFTSIIWIGAISAIAFGSWRSVSYLRSFRYVEITLLAGIIGVLLGSHIISHFAKMKLANDSTKSPPLKK